MHQAKKTSFVVHHPGQYGVHKGENLRKMRCSLYHGGQGLKKFLTTGLMV